MEDRKQALTMARINRLCPPPEIKKTPGQQDELKQHMLVCPYCNEEQDEDLEDWDDFLQSIGNVLFSEKDTTPVAPGRFFYLKKALACWRDKYFYNPPMVMVLDAAPVASDNILVAQAYHDARLAGPGDLVLTEENGITGRLFVEPWNVYTLRSSDLGPAMDAVSLDIVDEVKKMEASPEYQPSWANKPASFQEHDPRIYFREMEIEVGYTFSHRAVEALVDEMLEDDPILSYGSLQDLRKDVELMDMVLEGADVASSPEALLSSMRFPPESMAMAAASDIDANTGQQVPEEIITKLVYLKNGKIIKISPVFCRIFARDMTSEGLVLSGRIIDLPLELQSYRLLCFLRKHDGTIVEASEVDLDMKNSWFLANFKDADNLLGEIQVTILADE